MTFRTLTIFIISLNAFGIYASDSFNKLVLKKANLDHLPEADKVKVIRLLNDTIISFKNSSKNDPKIEGVKRYFTNKGYKSLYLKVLTVNSDDWLVVNNGFSSSATKDLPLGLNSFLFKEGYYYCKSNVFGGISEMIDGNGYVQNFFLSDWKDIR